VCRADYAVSQGDTVENETRTVITNRVTPRYTVSKIWKSLNGETAPRPDSVTAVLEHRDPVTGSWDVVESRLLNADNRWSSEFDTLFNAAESADYRIRERDGYNRHVAAEGDADAQSDADCLAVFEVDGRDLTYFADYYTWTAAPNVTDITNWWGELYAVRKVWTPADSP